VISAVAMLTLLAVSQDIGQRGTTFTLRLPQGAKEVFFYQPGLKIDRLVADKAGSILHLTAPADCRLGEYAYRVRTASGFSPLATLRLTPFPVIDSAEADHSTPATAQRVPLNVSIRGTLEAEQTACYAVMLQKGQRLAAEIEGVRLGRGPVDLALRIQDPEGRIVTEVDDTPLFRQDPFATVQAAVSGTYVVSVLKSGTEGDQEPYALHLGDFIRPRAIFPPGGQAGKTVRVRLLGDAMGERSQEVRLPTTPGLWEFYPSDGRSSAPTPHPFRVSTFADLNESDSSNDVATSPRAATWPVAFNGIISKAGERDHFRFPANKGQAIEIKVYAWQLGSPLDSFVAVFGPDGRLLAHNDDDETHDSRIRFVAERDGDHVVQITDKRKNGGPLYFYRIEVDRPVASVSVFKVAPARKSQTGNSIAVPRGNRVLAFLGVQRKGHDDPVTILPGSLPDGVQMSPAQVKAGEYLTPVVFEARPNAPLSGALVPFTARSGSLQGGFVQIVDLAPGPGDSSLHSVSVDRLAVAVVEPVPYRVSIIPPSTGLARAGSLEVRVKVERDADFTGPLDVSLPLLPHGVTTVGKISVPADNNEAVFSLVASEEVEPGNWPLFAEVRPGRIETRLERGLGTLAPRRSRRGMANNAATASAPVTLSLLDSPIKGSISPMVAEQGQTVEVLCRLEGQLSIPLQATLDGLPPRAKSEAVAVLPKQNTVRFRLTLDPTTPTGTHTSLSVVLAGQNNGDKFTYRVGQKSTLIVVEPGKRAIGKDGKPLSPLELLRATEKP